jgi:AhpD family alkylhydroperoxidase
MDLTTRPVRVYGVLMTSIDHTTDPAAARLDFDAHAPAFSKALAHLDHAAIKELDRVGFDAKLRELVRLRASQINGCAYCVDMHTTDARAIGESEQRLTGLPVWRETPFFDPRERAALALTEAVTLMANDHVPVAVWDEAAEFYSEDELGALVALITAINAWNTVGVSTRAWMPGSYQP